MNEFYVYLYLREDNTPYYVGKGKGDRAFSNQSRRFRKPKDKTKIIFHSENLTEEEAFKIEKELITKYGRKNNRTGILRNLTDGGEGSSGVIISDETKAKMSEASKKRMNTPEMKAKVSAESKERMNKPEIKAKMSAAMKKKMNTPEMKARLSQNNVMYRPEVKAKHLETMNSAEVKARHLEAINRPEVREKFLAAMASPERKAKLSQNNGMHRPEIKTKQLAAVKEAMNRPEIRTKHLAAIKEYWRKKREAEQAFANTLTKFFSE